MNDDDQFADYEQPLELSSPQNNLSAKTNSSYTKSMWDAFGDLDDQQKNVIGSQVDIPDVKIQLVKYRSQLNGQQQQEQEEDQWVEADQHQQDKQYKMDFSQQPSMRISHSGIDENQSQKDSKIQIHSQFEPQMQSNQSENWIQNKQEIDKHETKSMTTKTIDIDDCQPEITEDQPPRTATINNSQSMNLVLEEIMVQTGKEQIHHQEEEKKDKEDETEKKEEVIEEEEDDEFEFVKAEPPKQIIGQDDEDQFAEYTQQEPQIDPQKVEVHLDQQPSIIQQQPFSTNETLEEEQFGNFQESVNSHEKPQKIQQKTSINHHDNQHNHQPQGNHNYKFPSPSMNLTLTSHIQEPTRSKKISQIQEYVNKLPDYSFMFLGNYLDM